MFAISAYKNRSTSYQGSLYEIDGTTPVVLAAGDTIRFKVGRDTVTYLEFDQDANSAGSVVTIDDYGSENSDDDDPARYTIHLRSGDTKYLEHGIYDCEIMVYDVSAEQPILVEQGVLTVEKTLGGSVTA